MQVVIQLINFLDVHTLYSGHTYSRAPDWIWSFPFSLWIKIKLSMSRLTMNWGLWVTMITCRFSPMFLKHASKYDFIAGWETLSSG